MKTHGVCECKGPHIRKPRHYEEVGWPMFGHLYPLAKPRYSFYRRLSGSLGHSEHREKNNLHSVCRPGLSVRQAPCRLSRLTLYCIQSNKIFRNCVMDENQVVAQYGFPQEAQNHQYSQMYVRIQHEI